MVVIKNGLIHACCPLLFVEKIKKTENHLHADTFYTERIEQSKERRLPDLDTEDKANQEPPAHGRQGELQEEIELKEDNKSKQCLRLPSTAQNILGTY